MPVIVQIPPNSGNNNTVPVQGDFNWGQYTTATIIALAQNMFPKQGNFFLTGDVNLGASFGLIAAYFTSATLNPAQSGVIRLAHSDNIAWRNNANNGDDTLGVNSSDQLVYNGVPVGGAGGSLDIAISGNTTGTTALISTGTAILAGGNNIRLSQVGNSITISGSNFVLPVSAGTTTNSATGLTFSNSNNISFGLNNGIITASANAAAAQTGISGLVVSNTTYTSGTVTFQNANGISFGSSGANGISASYTVPSTAGLISRINVSAGTTSNNLSALTFSNSNNITFGLNGSVVTASASYSQSTQPVAISGSNGSFTFSTLSLGNSNGLSFYSTNNSIVGSYTVPTQSTQPVAISGSNGSFTFSTLTMGNLNGISHYTSNGSLVASYTVPTQTTPTGTTFAGANISGSMTLNAVGLNLSLSAAAAGGGNLNVSAGTTSNNLTNLVFSNANGVSFGLNGSTITGSITPSGGAQTAISGLVVSNTTYTSGTVTFQNANGISFGSSGANGISASYTVPTQTVQPVAVSGSNGSFAFSTLTMGNLNGLSHYTSNGSIVGSYTVPSVAGLISNINVSAGTTSNNLSAVTFSNSNGLSFGLNGSVITGSYTVPTQTVQPVAVSGSNGSFAFSTLTMGNLNGISHYTSNGSLVASYTVPSTVGLISGINVSGGTTSNNLSAITFSNANGVSFGMNGSVMTASITPAGGAQTGISGLVVSNTTYTSGTVTFQNANGISFGSSGANGISASYTVPSTAGLISNINVSAGTTSNNLSALTFSNSNGLSFGLNGSVITGSYTVPTQSVQTIGIYGSSQTTGSASSATYDARSLSIIGAGIISIGNASTSIGGTTNGLIISASQSVQPMNISVLGVASFSANTLIFKPINSAGGVSFDISASSIVGFVQNTQSIGIVGGNTLGNTGYQTSAIGFAGGNNITLSGSTNGGGNFTMSIIGATPPAISAAGSSQNAGTLVFSNSNGVSFGMNGSTITASVAGGAGGVGISASGSSQTAGNIVFSNSNGVSFGMSGSTITATVIPGAAAGLAALYDGANSITSGTVRFSNSNNISFGINGQTITGSVPAITSIYGSGGILISSAGSSITVNYTGASTTASGYAPFPKEALTFATAGNSQLIINSISIPYTFQFDNIRMPVYYTNATNSSGGRSISVSIALYTESAGTLSLLTSAGVNQNITGSGTVGNYSLYSGWKNMTMGLTTTLSPGIYYVGLISITSSSSQNASISHGALLQAPAGQNTASQYNGFMGVSHAPTNMFYPWQGVYTGATAAFPATIVTSQLNGGSAAAMQPFVNFASGSF